MPKVGNQISVAEVRCSRCGSRRVVSKKWTEKIPNTNGFMTLYHTEYKCTNKKCQAEFEKTILTERDKAERLKQIKMEDAARRASKNTT